MENTTFSERILNFIDANPVLTTSLIVAVFATVAGILVLL